MASTKTIHAEAKGKNRQLVIESLEKKDAGEYICEAGTEKLVFKIHVEGRRHDITDISVGKCVYNLPLWFVAQKIVPSCLYSIITSVPLESGRCRCGCGNNLFD